MTEAVIDKRLESCADLVRQGAVLADIGTDHGYLPLYLLRAGIISEAVLTDVNEGPLATARANALESGLLEKVRFVLTDGAAALSDMGITDLAVCGMGGHLIMRIIDNAPWLRSSNIRLVLQPMTKAADLRRYLCDSGFAIEKEVYSYAKGKHYVALLASYTGAKGSLSELDAHLGAFVLPPDPYYLGYLKEQVRILKKIIGGKRSAEQSAERESALLNEAERRIGEIEK